MTGKWVSRAVYVSVHAIRRRVDSLVASVQHRPGVERLLKVLRRPLAWVVRRFFRAAFDRQELIQAREIMRDAPEQPVSGPKILFMSFRMWANHVTWDVTMAQALRLRGARCEFFFSGGGLPICEIGWAATAEVSPCVRCGNYVAAMADAAGFPRIRLDDLVPPHERDALMKEVEESNDPQEAAERLAGRPLGAAIEPSLVWFFRSATLPDTEAARNARRDFLSGAAIMARATPRLLETVKPDTIVMVNGRFYEEEIVRQIAGAEGVRVVSYEVGAQRETLFFSEGVDRPASDYSIEDLWDRFGNAPLSGMQEAELARVIADRRSGANAHRRYYQKPRSLDSDGAKPRVVLFTNVTWDTAVIGKNRAFPSMFDWIRRTIEDAMGDPAYELVVRVHPAESRWSGLESSERFADWASREFGELPSHVRIVRPEESVDSYSLMDDADVVLVYSSTVGLEAAVLGKPVCIAGDTHYRGRGFTVDIDSPAEYDEVLRKIRKGDLAAAAPDLARRYAYLFFCRAMIPFPAVDMTEFGEPRFRYGSVAELGEGRDLGLDLICESLLGKGSFRLDADLEATANR
ncbi:MAG: hypothetical protein QOH90_281 [Actinomycetota bacterium]|nr:hypothetical protein [Actinomycetota bacterium]